MINFIKAMALSMVFSPILFLTYQKLISQYIEFLWPDVRGDGYGGLAILAVFGALISGAFIGGLYSNSKK